MILKPLTSGKVNQVSTPSASTRVLPPLTSLKTAPTVVQPKKVEKPTISQPAPVNKPSLLESAKSVFQGIQQAVAKIAKPKKDEGLGAPIGRLLQKVPDTTIKIPEKYKSEGLYDEIVEFTSGLPGSIAQSYGRSLELLSTPDGKKQLKEGAKNLPKTMNEVKAHIDNKEWGKAFETAFSNPAVSVALDVSDFIPIAGVVGFGVKKTVGGLRKTAQQVVKEGIEETEKKVIKTVDKSKSKIEKPTTPKGALPQGAKDKLGILGYTTKGAKAWDKRTNQYLEANKTGAFNAGMGMISPEETLAAKVRMEARIKALQSPTTPKGGATIKLNQESQKTLNMIKTRIPDVDENKLFTYAKKIAELDGSKEIQPQHLAEAIQYRVIDNSISVERLLNSQGGNELLQRAKDVGVSGVDDKMFSLTKSIRDKYAKLDTNGKSLVNMYAKREVGEKLDVNGLNKINEILKNAGENPTVKSLAESMQSSLAPKGGVGEIASTTVEDVKRMDAYKKTYRKGKMLSADDVREVYTPEGYNRRNSAEFHERSSALTDKIFDEDVATLKKGDNYLFTAGVSGSGKTSAIRDNAAAFKDFTLGLDGNFSSSKSLTKVESVLEKGADVDIIFTYRKPLDAWINGVVKRATNPKNGRVVPLEVFLKNLVDSKERVLQAYKKFGEKVQIQVIDNSRGKGNSRVIGNPIDFLNKINYNVGDEKRKIIRLTEEKFRKGEISQEIKELLIGKKTISKPQPQRAKQRNAPVKSQVERVSFNTRQSKAIQESFVDHLNNIKQTATSAEELAIKTDKLVQNAIRKSRGDKTVLAGIRTALSKDLSGYAGKSGNYKKDFATLQTLKNDPDIAPHINSLEDNIAKIDDLLLQPSTIQIKSNIPEKLKVPRSDITSRVFERMKAEHPELFSGDLKIDKINLAKEVRKAEDLLAKDKQKAYRIAMGEEVSPDITSTNVNIVMVEKALEENNIKLAEKLIRNRSLAQTRRGQEIVSEKASITDNSVSRYVKELLSTRLDNMGKKYLGNIENLAKRTSNKEKAIKAIDSQVENIQNRIKNKKLDMKSALSLLDKLTCV